MMTGAEPGGTPGREGMRDASQAPARQSFTCACCGHEVVTAIEGLFANPQVGSPRRFCDPACRQAAFRRRRAGAPEDSPLQRHGGRGRRLMPPGSPDRRADTAAVGQGGRRPTRGTNVPPTRQAGDTVQGLPNGAQRVDRPHHEGGETTGATTPDASR